ncbi:MAG TPA: ROK family protein [Patescibacteria group bacterium]|nr:ROK family protein [Patescibacteria group bacterium]
MYVGIDVGGTKTIVASLNNEGVIKDKKLIPTDNDYDKFLGDIKSILAEFDEQEYEAGGIGVPATVLNRKDGIALKFGNLHWKNVAIQRDIEQLTHCPIVVENDAKLAALSEAMLLKDKYKTVLYITISTGIGFGFVNNSIIDQNFGDGGGRTLLLEFKNKIMPWEDFASGRAIVNRYGKKAKDISDKNDWQDISRNIAKGVIELIAMLEPEVIVIGGGVGNYFEKFGKYLESDVKKYHIPLIKMPDIIKAQRPDEAVIFGCYDLAKQVYPHARINS